MRGWRCKFEYLQPNRTMDALIQMSFCTFNWLCRCCVQIDWLQTKNKTKKSTHTRSMLRALRCHTGIHAMCWCSNQYTSIALLSNCAMFSNFNTAFICWLFLSVAVAVVVTRIFFVAFKIVCVHIPSIIIFCSIFTIFTCNHCYNAHCNLHEKFHWKQKMNKYICVCACMNEIDDMEETKYLATIFYPTLGASANCVDFNIQNRFAFAISSLGAHMVCVCVSRDFNREKANTTTGWKSKW